MQIASVLAGFTMPQAEVIMRAMGKKDHDKMAQMKPLFMQGCMAHGVPEAATREIYAQMETFASYGFNKSHASAYGLVAYWTAYLKANYPAEFMAAHLSTVMDSSEDVAKGVTECRRMGLEVRSPSVNRSQAHFAVGDSEVLFGLAAIKNLGGQTVEAIVAERESNGPYLGLADVCRRLPGEKVPNAAVRLLIQAGAFDEFGERNRLLAALDNVYASGQKYQQDLAVGQNSLFGGGPTAAAEYVEPPLPEVPPMGEEEVLELEKELLGLYLSSHPLLKNQEKVAQCTTAAVEELGQFAQDTPVLVAGLIAETKRHIDKNGNAMMFLTLEGLAEQVEVTVFPRVCEACREHLVNGTLVVMQARVDKQLSRSGNDEEVKLLCEKARPLSAAQPVSERHKKQAEKGRQPPDTKPAQPQPSRAVVIEFDCARANDDNISALKQLIQRYHGTQRVVLQFADNGQRRLVALGDNYMVNCADQFPIEARQVAGVITLWEEDTLQRDSTAAKLP